MKKSNLFVLKAWAPLLTLAVAPGASSNGGFGIARISFWQTKQSTNSCSDTFIDIRSSENGLLRGQGKFAKDNFHMQLISATAGAQQNLLCGQIEGKKAAGKWLVQLTPEGSSENIILSCTEATSQKA